LIAPDSTWQHMAVSLVVAAGILLASSAQLSAQPDFLDVATIDQTESLGPYVQYLRLSDAEEANISAVLQSEFASLPNDEISFGYTTDQFWFLLDAINTSDIAKNLVLDTNVKFMEPLAIFSVSEDQQVSEIFRGDELRAFNPRPLATPKLTFPLSWGPGEHKRLLFYVRSGSGVDMTLELGESQGVLAKYINNRIFFALFTGILATLILINLFHFYAVGRWAHLFYATQELSILLFMLHMDGLAFQFLWPGSPVWNAHATMVFGHLVNLMALLFTISFLELKSRAPMLYRTLSGIAGVSFVMLCLTPVVEPDFSDLVGLVTSGLGGPLLFATGVLVAIRGYRPARYFVAGWLFMSVGSLLYGLANLGFISLPFAPIMFLRVGVLAEALLLSYGLSDQLKTLNDTARDTQQRLLESTQERLREAQDRIALEQARYEAERELQEKDLDIARTRHDIRQPIYSLRLAILAQKESSAGAATNEVINRSLDHMEQLLIERSADDDESPRSISLQTFGDLLGQLQSEFASEAADRNISIEVVDCRRELDVPLVPLKRVISNLMANAIRHSGGRRLLVGFRRKGGGLELLLADNGSGMSNTRTNSKNKGQGLGMGIVRALCKDHGWTLNCSSADGRGTCFRVVMPA